jgi:hypothetical protein
VMGQPRDASQSVIKKTSNSIANNVHFLPTW